MDLKDPAAKVNLIKGLTGKQIDEARAAMPPICIDLREQWPLFAKPLQKERDRVYENDYFWNNEEEETAIKVKFMLVSGSLSEGDYLLQGFKPTYDDSGKLIKKGGLLIERKSGDLVNTLANWQYKETGTQTEDRFERELRRFADYEEVYIIVEKHTGWYQRDITERAKKIILDSEGKEKKRKFKWKHFVARDVKLTRRGNTEANWSVKFVDGHEQAEFYAYQFFWDFWKNKVEQDRSIMSWRTQ